MEFTQTIKCDSCKNRVNCKHIKHYYDDHYEYHAMFNTLETLQSIKDDIIRWSEKCTDYEYNDISNVGFE